MAGAPKVHIETPPVADGRAERAERPGPSPEDAAPRPTSPPAPGRAEDAGDVGAAGGGDAEEAVAATGKAARAGVGRTLSSWLTYHFPGHEHAVVGAACGLVVALLVFAIGLLRTLFVVVLVAAGAAVGQALDGDPRIVRIIRQIVSERRG